MAQTISAAVYDALTSEDDGRVCKDIPEAACREQPGNFVKHVLSLAATKTGDGLADPKLVLSWLLTTLGAPAFLVGLLVPIREAGALLPQLFISAGIRALPQRKWVWAGGSLIQGTAVLGMGLCAILLDGAAAGWAIVGLLSLFALARSVCSVSYKDVLGKTVSKATRGTATGTATTAASALVLLFGLLLSTGLLEKSVSVIAAVLFVAGGLWIAAAGVFSTLEETAGASEGGGNPIAVAIGQLSLLRDDPQLTRFIVTRGLLISTALAPPYVLSVVSRGHEQQLGVLGPFVLASALAAVSSSYIWGRLSDKSSRKVLMLAAIVGALALAAGIVVAGVIEPLEPVLPMSAVLFLLMVAYQGVRLGRSTHLVDMVDENKRAAYTALSNSIVGLLLVFGSIFGAIAQFAGEAFVLALFAVMCVAAAVAAHGLREVQE